MNIGCRVVSFQIMRKQLEIRLIIILVFTLIFIFSAAFRPLLSLMDMDMVFISLVVSSHSPHFTIHILLFSQKLDLPPFPRV